MYKDKKIGAVVCAYNEQKLIGRVIETIPGFVDRIYVIDDCSEDSTSQRVSEYLADLGGKLTLTRHEENQGVGGAIATGYKKALEDDMDAAVVMAGDAQMDPRDLPALLDPVVAGDVDYSKGNRLFTGDAWRKIPRIRYLGNALLSLLTKVASGYWHVADSQSGYTAIGKQALATIDWDRMYKRYGQPNDLLVRLNVYSFRVRDVPVKPIYGIGESSGIRPLLIVPKLLWLLFRLFLWRMKEKYVIRDFHPLLFFYATGLLLLPAGIALGSYLVTKRILFGPVAATSALFAAFLATTGLQSVFFGMLFDMEANKDLK